MYTQTNHQHWQAFYQESDVPGFPSQFSMFVQSWLASSDMPVVELGCGNGRDAVFFHNQGRNVAVTDQVVVSGLVERAEQSENFHCVEGDAADVVSALAQSLDFEQPVAVYSRFFQHAINPDTEHQILSELAARLHTESLLFFEFRLAADEHQPKVFGTDHYRRFQSSEEFKDVLRKAGLECIYSCEGHGYAVFSEEDPYVGRFVARKAEHERPALRLV